MNLNLFKLLESDPCTPIKSTRITIRQLGISKFVYVERKK